MNIYRNTKFTKRNYECTNIVACVAESAPASNYEACSDDLLRGLTRLHTQNGATFYGYL